MAERQQGKRQLIQQKEKQRDEQRRLRKQRPQQKKQREKRPQQMKISVSESWISICSAWERIMTFIKKWVHMKQ